MASKLSRRRLLAGALLNAATGAALPVRTLGRSALRVTALGLGCSTKDAAAVARAFDLGINYVNIDPKYDDMAALAAALRGRRAKIVVSTLVRDGQRDAVFAELDRELKQLGTDYLDFVYFHRASNSPQVTDEFLEAASAARKAGKIRYAGVSSHQMQIAAPQLCAQSVIDIVMVTCNFRADQEALDRIAALKKAGLGIAAMKPMAGGPGKENTRSQDTMAAILRWVLASPLVDTAPVAMSSVEQVELNVAAAGVAFGDADRALLELDRRSRAAVDCRVCGACAGQCRMGLPVSDLVRAAMYAEGYRDRARAARLYAGLPQVAREPACIRCPQCTVQCRNGLAAPDRITAAHRLLG